MSRKRFEPEPLGHRFGRSDLDRLGYFHDPNPAPFDKYQGVPFRFRQGIEKGRQILAGPPSKLFEEKFVRIFDGEALYEPWRFEAAERLEREQAKLGSHMLPPSPAKKHATPGDWYGCFEKIPHFSPALRPTKRKEPELPNAKIKPNPKGGPGYPDICLSRFPEYSYNPYDPPKRRQRDKALGRFLSASAPLDFFPPNPYLAESIGPTYVRPKEFPPKMLGPGRLYVPFPKKPGGNHSGCFEKFPLYSSDPYDKGIKEAKVEGVIVAGGPALRTKYTNSIISQVTRIACNATNYQNYREQVYVLDK
ncbi:cilia-and flagella-associated protein 96 [Megachile rotundata]|uniref:cilia-and flagella-associated protein 96 n=1 Tax=Megachile rotundata TaxID=143995 RepID=UPI003FD577B6